MTWRLQRGITVTLNKLLGEEEAKRHETNPRKVLQNYIVEKEDSDVKILFVSHLFRSVGQVVFLDNSVSGIIISIGILQTLAKQFAYALVATATALLLTLSLLPPYIFMGKLRRNLGLFGFNAVLVGMGMSVFLDLDDDNVLGWFLLLIPAIFGGAFSMVVKMTMESLSSTIPVLTFPFNFTMLVWLTFAYSISWLFHPYVVNYEANTVRETFNYGDYLDEIDGSDLMKGILRGFSQVYVVEDWVCGLLIFLAMLFHDEEVALLAFVGSTMGACMGILMGAPLESIYAGLYGYNPLLVLIVCGKILVNLKFLFHWYNRYPSAFLFSLLTVPVHVCIGAILRPWNIPAMTFPFCFMSLFFLLIERWIHIHVKSEQKRRSSIVDAFDKKILRAIKQTMREKADAESSDGEDQDVFMTGEVAMNTNEAMDTIEGVDMNESFDNGDPFSEPTSWNDSLCVETDHGTGTTNV